jgi:hypothetical protein
MGINPAAFAQLRLQALAPQFQPAPQPVAEPEAAPEAAPVLEAGQAQALSADALSGARSLGNAWTDLLSVAQPAPSPLSGPSLADTGFSAEQAQAMDQASLRLRIAQAGGQEAYDRQQAAASAITPEQRQKLQGMLDQLTLIAPAPTPPAIDFRKNVSADSVTQAMLGFYNNMADYYTKFPPVNSSVSAFDLL